MPDDPTPTTPAPERPPFTTEDAQRYRDRLSGPLRGRGETGERSSILRTLAEHPEPLARVIAAERSDSGVQLRTLASDRHRTVRLAVAFNESAPHTALEVLAEDRTRPVRLAVAGNGRTSPDVLEQLGRVRDHDFREAVAGNWSAPAEVLVRLARDRIVRVRLAVADNPYAPPEAVEILMDDEQMFPIAAILDNPEAFGEVGLRHLAGSPFPRYRWAAAENPNTPPDVLDALASDVERVPGRYIGHWNPIRMAVAANPGTPVEVISRLATDDHADVRWFAAANPRTPIDVLEALAGDDDSRVRCFVAEHRTSTSVLLGQLAGDLEPDVRRNVAANRRCPLAALRRMAIDEDEHVRKAVAAHPKADEDLRLLAVPPEPEPEPVPDRRPRAHRRTRPAPTPDPTPTPCDGETCANVICFGDLHVGEDLLYFAAEFPLATWSYEGDSPGSVGSFELYGFDGLYWSHDDHGWHAMDRFDSDEEAITAWRTGNCIDEREQEAAAEEEAQIREWLDSLEPTACHGACKREICIDGWHIHVDVIEHMEPDFYFPPDEPMKEDPTHQLFGQQGLYWRSTGDGHEGLGRFSNDDDLLRAWRDARLRDQESGTTGVEGEEAKDLDAD